MSAGTFNVWWASARDIREVCRSMREASAREAFASRADDDRDHLAGDLCRLGANVLLALGIMRFGVSFPYRPLALLGAVPLPGGDCATMVWLAAEGWPAIALPTHRFWRRTFVPRYLTGYREVSFLGGADTTTARWVAGLGFTPDGEPYRHGKHGDLFVRYVRRRTPEPALV